MKKILFVGAEVYYFRGMGDSNVLRELAIRGTDSVMVELPDAPWPERVWQDLQEIRQNWAVDRRFETEILPEVRADRLAHWKKAVACTSAWSGE